MRDDEPNSAFRTVAVTPLVTIGRFRAEPRHPQFACSGPARWTSFVFPRRAVRIVRSPRERLVATPNVVMFYNFGDEYRREAIDPGGDLGDFFVLHPALLVPALEAAGCGEPGDPERPFRARQLPCDSKSYLEQRGLTRYLNRSPAPDGLLVEETVVGLLARVLRSQPAGSRTGRSGDGAGSRRRALAERTEELLALRFRENLTLVELASAVASSPAHLTRVFRSEVGRTLHQYRRDLRLRAALELVIDPKCDLTAIALDLGFSSHSHFSWSFRQAFGIPPSSLRGPDAARRRRDAIVTPATRMPPRATRRLALRAQS